VLGSLEIIVVVTAILILFGPQKIPEFAKYLGSGIEEFKKAASNISNISDKD